MVLTGRERGFGSLVADFWGNATVAFLGDGANHALSLAAECEAAKLGGSGWGYAGAGGHPATTVRNAGFRLTERLDALARHNDAVGWPSGSWWDAPLVDAESGAVFVHKGFARYNASDWDSLLPLLDVALVNYGHHYPPGEVGAYEGDMKALFVQLEAWVAAAAHTARPRVALFRETGAQHVVQRGAFKRWDEARLGGGGCWGVWVLGFVSSPPSSILLSAAHPRASPALAAPPRRTPRWAATAGARPRPRAGLGTRLRR